MESTRSTRQKSCGLIYFHLQKAFNLKLISCFVIFQILTNHSQPLTGVVSKYKYQTSVSCWKHTSLKTSSDHFSRGTCFFRTLWSLPHQKIIKMVSVRKNKLNTRGVLGASTSTYIPWPKKTLKQIKKCHPQYHSNNRNWQPYLEKQYQWWFCEMLLLGSNKTWKLWRSAQSSSKFETEPKKTWPGCKNNSHKCYTDLPHKTTLAMLLWFLVLISRCRQTWWICRSFEDIIVVSAICCVASTFFSKYTFVVPIKRKTDDQVVSALKKITEKWKLQQLHTDWGTVFLNKPMTRWLTQENIRLFNTDNYKVNAAVVEQCNQMLTTRMWWYFTAHNTQRYVECLKVLAKPCNNTFHSSIGTPP